MSNHKDISQQYTTRAEDNGTQTPAEGDRVLGS